MHVVYEKLAIVMEYLVHHCCTEVTCRQHSTVRPILSTDDP